MSPAIDEKTLPTKLIEQVIIKTTGGLEEDKLQCLFSMNHRTRRGLHDDVTIVVIEFDTDNVKDISQLGGAFSKFRFVPSQEQTLKSTPKLLDIAQLLAQIPHDSENSDTDTQRNE